MAASDTPDVQASTTPTRIHLSSSARTAIRDMLVEEDLAHEGGLRISARLGAGCSTPLGFDLVLETEPEPDDVILEGDGIRIFLSPRDAWTLDGLEVDFVEDAETEAGFAFRHPRGTGRRSC